MLTYKSEYSFIYRKNESHRLISKYPDRVPIICESLITNNQNEPLLDKTKYLAPIDLTIGQFQYVIRKRMSLNKEKAIFLFSADFNLFAIIYSCTLPISIAASFNL